MTSPAIPEPPLMTITGDHVTSGDHHMTPNTPLVGTLNLKSITEKTSKKLSDRETMEVLGPVEYVWGHPLSVSVNHVTPGDQLGRLATPECRVLTMLYRRFSTEARSSGDDPRPHSSDGLSSLFLSSLARTKQISLPVRVQSSRRGVGVKGGWEGLHTIQLIPTFANSKPIKIYRKSSKISTKFDDFFPDVCLILQLLALCLSWWV